MMTVIRALSLLTIATGLLSIPMQCASAFGQEGNADRVSPASYPPVPRRADVADEWEIHRRAASASYRPVYRSIFVDPGYAGYCPIRPYWRGVYSAGGSPHATACCASSCR